MKNESPNDITRDSLFQLASARFCGTGSFSDSGSRNVLRSSSDLVPPLSFPYGLRFVAHERPGFCLKCDLLQLCALVLSDFYGIVPYRIVLNLIPFSVGNALGPMLFGKHFDTMATAGTVAWFYGVAAEGNPWKNS